MNQDRYFSVENTAKGTYRTFRLTDQPEDAKFAPGRTVLSLLVGAENSSDYRGFAFVDFSPWDGTRQVCRVWKSKQAQLGDQPTDWQRFGRLVERCLNLNPPEGAQLL